MVQSKHILIGTGLIVGCVLLSVVWFAVSFLRTVVLPVDPINEEVVDVFADLKGEVYMTLAPNSTGIARIYTYNFNTGKFSLVSNQNEVYRFTSKFNPSHTALAYFETTFNPEYATGREALGKTLSVPWQLFVETLTNNEKKAVATVPIAFAPRLPAWSPAEDYLAFARADMGFSDPNSWSVQILKLSSTTDGIDKSKYSGIRGTYPYWSPDGSSMIVMRRDGIYQHQFTDAGPIKVLELPGQSTTTGNAKIGVSPDGTKFAWTLINNPESALQLYDVTSWSPFTATPKANLEKPMPGQGFYWPTFSPDSKYFVVQRARRMAEPYGTDTDLIVYDVASGKSKIVYSLQGYDPDLTLITDWR